MQLSLAQPRETESVTTRTNVIKARVPTRLNAKRHNITTGILWLWHYNCPSRSFGSGKTFEKIDSKVALAGNSKDAYRALGNSLRNFGGSPSTWFPPDPFRDHSTNCDSSPNTDRCGAWRVGGHWQRMACRWSIGIVHLVPIVGVAVATPVGKYVGIVVGVGMGVGVGVGVGIVVGVGVNVGVGVGQLGGEVSG